MRPSEYESEMSECAALTRFYASPLDRVEGYPSPAIARMFCAKFFTNAH